MTAAKEIRKELKATFPGVKFSVTKGRGTASSSLSIDRTDGPTQEQVREVANKYTYGKFDAMTDSREVTNQRDDIPQVQYIMFSRMMSEETKEVITETASIVYKEAYGDNYYSYSLRDFIRNIFRNNEVNGVIKSIEQKDGETLSESFVFTY